MIPEFLAAVIDTLLPGDDVLPSGTAAGVALAPGTHAPVLQAVRTEAGGMDAFAQAPEAARVAVLQAVERAHPETFRALLVAVLSDYYEAALVLAALGWRSDPPQPWGHALPIMDSPTSEHLERVRQRDRLWRGRC
ncbi:MAG TPA: hypothetical protein VMQ73_03290 [Methylomirabilota bacterium]|nr:hypothetical protein [Methylomirabilota bacterium]